MESPEKARSPSPKRSKVLADESMPSPAAGKQQQLIDSYGLNGANRSKYVRKNPRNGEVVNEVPITVIFQSSFQSNFCCLRYLG